MLSVEGQVGGTTSSMELYSSREFFSTGRGRTTDAAVLCITLVLRVAFMIILCPIATVGGLIFLELGL